MSDREKLIELIESARYWGSNTSAEIADHLIANGVVIQKQAEWIEETETYGRTFYRCSRCNTTSRFGRPKQCRYCGSKMREVK